MKRLLALVLAGSLPACDSTSTATPDATVVTDVGVALDAAPDAAVEADAAVPDLGADAEVDAAPPDAAVEPDAGGLPPIPVGPDGRPEGWTDDSHGKAGSPDYPRVFPQDRVNRLDLRCARQTWTDMLADLTTLTGTPAEPVPSRPGGGGPGGGGPGGGPDVETLQAACEGLAEGAACESEAGAGQCVDEPGLGLLCLPEDPFGLPPEAFAACEGLDEGAACTPSFPGEDEGLCLHDSDGLACIPTSWLEGGPGGGPDGELPDERYSAAPFWPRKPAYFACDVTFEGRTWHRVGVRFKGNSTLAFSTGQTYKLPLRMDFDEFEDDFPAIDNQRFFGFKHLSMTNQIADNSYVRQKLTADLFRAAGVPAPQTAFYRFFLSLDAGEPQYLGLYTVTEVPRGPIIDAQLGGGDGTLYACDGSGARFAAFIPQSFHQKTNKSTDDKSRIEAFVTALNAEPGDAAQWRAGVEAVFDMEGFLRFLAVNQAVVNWDTYGGLAHNYFVYDDPERGQLRWLPWDFDLSLDGESDLSLLDAGEDWPLLYRVARDPVYAARYRALLAEVIAGPFAAEATVAEIDRLAALITPYVTGAEGEQPRYTALPSPEAFSGALDGLRAHVRHRGEVVRAFLAE